MPQLLHRMRKLVRDAHKQAAAALILCSASSGVTIAEEGERPMWEIAPAWTCYFIEEFRCSSQGKNCDAGGKNYRGLTLDFRDRTVSYLGGGKFPIGHQLHLSALRKSFFVQGQTEFFFQGGILWRTFLPRFAGTEFHLQAYRCSPE